MDKCEECEEDISKFYEDESEEELENLKKMAEAFDEYLEEDGVIPEDKKLSAEARKKLSAKTFCGPNRSFPVPDCAHVTAARRLIGRYKGPGSKAKILACVNRKAKKLGCKSSKDSETAKVLAELQKKHEALTKEKEGQDAKIAALEQSIKEKDSLIQASDKRIVDLTSQIKDKLAEKVIDLSLALKTSLVVDVLNAKDGKEFQEKYSEIKEKLTKRTHDSLSDTVSDLVNEFALNEVGDKVDQPGVDDNEEVNDPFRKIIEKKNEDNKNGSSVSAKIFGEKKDKEEK